MSRAGVAYMVYEDWNIYSVDLTTLYCALTPFNLGPLALAGSEEAVSVGTTLNGEEILYVVASDGYGDHLGAVDLGTFAVSPIGNIEPNPDALDIRVDAYGHLFGLASTGLFIQINPRNAALILSQQTTFPATGSWALLAWNGELFFFSNATVLQYDLAANALTPLGTVSAAIIGASAAPCITE